MSAPKTVWSPSAYQANASFVYSKEFTAPVLDLLDPKPGERILDLGCGTGELDADIAKAVGEKGFVFATDVSQEMLSRAQQSAKNTPNIEFAMVDAAHLSPTLQPTFPNYISASNNRPFDAVFSNAALHWILHQAPDKLAVFKAIHALLTPAHGIADFGDEGGRFAAEFPGSLNIAGLRGAIWRALTKRGYDPTQMDPWFFSGVEETTKLLEDAGFEVKHISLNPRITPLPGTIKDWLRTFWLGSFLDFLPPMNRDDDPKGYEAKEKLAEEIMDEIERETEVDSKDSFSGKWSLMYCRLRFLAIAKVQ